MGGLLCAVFVSGFAAGRSPVGRGAEGVAWGTVPADLQNTTDFSMFWDVWRLVKDVYVEQPVKDEDLYHGALQGLLTGLNDPYSSYFDPKTAQEFNEELSGTFSGIGAEIGLSEDGIVTVVSPIADTPAARAGLQPKDLILAIDGVDTAGMTVPEAVTKIRGQKGTDVKLGLYREGKGEFEVTITRDDVQIKSVKTEYVGDVAVIDVTVFGDDTSASFARAINEAQKKGVNKFVIDLRNNPGGYFDAAIDMASHFVGSRTVVWEEVRGNRTPFAGTSEADVKNAKVVVLVNGGSASASEILAGALQDYDLATIIGTQSFGKGTVQEYHELPDGGAVKITVARWLTPNGRGIDKEGITPDVIVEAAPADPSHATDKDIQRQAALDLLAK